jgi:glycosyltransferase involved in cell wall biosynthesis
MSPCICLVTTGHPSTNPRLVKEADALSEAGFEVRVVACKFVAWADRADAEFDDRPWRVEWVRFGEMASFWEGAWMRVRRKLARQAISRVGYHPMLAERALHYVVPELKRKAMRGPADLYIAHNLAALPAAAAAARRHEAKLGFDAEDFHRGQFAEETGAEYALTCWAEERYIPGCDYVTAASEGIAEAYAHALGIPTPVTIDNVFPLSEREMALPETALQDEKVMGTRTLYWFSQTIGAGRGLEDVLRALPRLDPDVHLVVRGQWADGFETSFMTQAEELGVRDRVRSLAPVPPGELIVRAAQHDVGLALEQPRTRNRQLCVTNKIFTYLLAGIPALATDTEGQRRVCAHAPEATRLVPAGDPVALAEGAQQLLDERGRARVAADRAATDRFNWEIESQRFLAVVRRCLGSKTRRDAHALVPHASG